MCGEMKDLVEVLRTYDSDLTKNQINDLLWNYTCFPLGDWKITIKQALAEIRARKNKIIRCHLCGAMEPFHETGCLDSVTRGLNKQQIKIYKNLKRL
jgi:hypothetical protein